MSINYNGVDTQEGKDFSDINIEEIDKNLNPFGISLEPTLLDNIERLNNILQKWNGDTIQEAVFIILLLYNYNTLPIFNNKVERDKSNLKEISSNLIAGLSENLRRIKEQRVNINFTELLESFQNKYLKNFLDLFNETKNILEDKLAPFDIPEYLIGTIENFLSNPSINSHKKIWGLLDCFNEFNVNLVNCIDIYTEDSDEVLIKDNLFYLIEHYQNLKALETFVRSIKRKKSDLNNPDLNKSIYTLNVYKRLLGNFLFFYATNYFGGTDVIPDKIRKNFHREIALEKAFKNVSIDTIRLLLEKLIKIIRSLMDYKKNISTNTNWKNLSFKINTNQRSNYHIDYISLALCGGIYNVTNDILFEYVTETFFMSFINLYETQEKIKIYPRKKNYVIHLIDSVSQTISKSSCRQEWVEEIVKKFNIPKHNFDSHRKDFYNESKATKKNLKFKEALQDEINTWFELQKLTIDRKKEMRDL